MIYPGVICVSLSICLYVSQCVCAGVLSVVLVVLCDLLLTPVNPQSSYNRWTTFSNTLRRSPTSLELTQLWNYNLSPMRSRCRIKGFVSVVCRSGTLLTLQMTPDTLHKGGTRQPVWLIFSTRHIFVFVSDDNIIFYILIIKTRMLPLYIYRRVVEFWSEYASLVHFMVLLYIL